MVDNLKISATSKLFKLYQSKVWLDSGRVAIHDQTDGSGRCHDRRLRIAIAMPLTQLKRLIPAGLCQIDQFHIGTVFQIKRHRIDCQAFVAIAIAIGGIAVVPDYPQHMLFIASIAAKGPQFAGDFRAG